MPLPVILIVAFTVSIIASLAAAAPLTRVKLHGRSPERGRYGADSSTPRLGGVAIFAATPIAVLGAALFKLWMGADAKLPDLAQALIASSAVLFAVGLLDDVRRVKPLAKLIAQTGAAVLIYAAGFRIEHVTFLPGYVIDLGMLALPITVFWLIGISNAFNLVDGMDGLAGGVAIVGLVASLVAALFLGNPTVPVYTVALIGALLGFMRYNWPSARLFLGDSGSLVVGFLLAVFSVKAATDPHKLTYGLVPIFALAYPLLDTGVAMLRRWLRGVPLSRADVRHVHHQLRAIGLKPTSALYTVYSATAFVALLGLVAAFAPAEVTMISTIFGLTILFTLIVVSVNWLQYHEFTETGSSIANVARKAPSVIRDKINARDLTAIIGQAKTLPEIQAVLEDNASTFRFAYMKLATPQSRLRIPGRITQELQELKMWKLEYPIVYNNDAEYDGLALTIWCDLDDTSQRPAGAERVASILGPAIADWATRVELKPLTVAATERLLHGPYLPVADIALADMAEEDDRRTRRGVKWSNRRTVHGDHLYGNGRPGTEERATQG